MKLLLCFLTVTVAIQAGEFVVLSSGFRIHAVEGAVVPIQTPQGAIELPIGKVAAFEPEEYAPPAAVPSPPPVSGASMDVHPALTPQELTTRAAILSRTENPRLTQFLF